MSAIDAAWLNRHLMSSTFAHGYKNAVARIECADGYSVSVQASEHTYCSPRDNRGPWTQVECGFPRDSAGGIAVDEWQEWSDDPGSTSTVYGYVPIAVVVEWINSHGGAS